MPHRRLTLALACTATAVVFSSGGAVAARLITGAQIQNGTITSLDVRNGTLIPRDLSPATVRSFNRPGPRGRPGLARGWGRVAADGTVTHKSAGVTVTKPSPGVYCITVRGVAPASSVVVATPDFAEDSTGAGTNNSQSFVEVDTRTDFCPDSAQLVRTFVRSYTASSGDLVETNLQATDQPFTFLVP